MLTSPHLHGFPKERVKHDPKTSTVDAVTLDTRLCFIASAPLYLLRVRKEGKTLNSWGLLGSNALTLPTALGLDHGLAGQESEAAHRLPSFHTANWKAAHILIRAHCGKTQTAATPFFLSWPALRNDSCPTQGDQPIPGGPLRGSTLGSLEPGCLRLPAGSGARWSSFGYWPQLASQAP